MLWNTMTGRGSLVPTTVAHKRILEGTKSHPPSAFKLRDPSLPQREPIPETCEICDKRRASVGNPPQQRRMAQDERLEDRQQMRSLIREIVSALRPDIGMDTSEAEDEIAGEVERQVVRRQRGRRS
jgi:hypothetical protein